MFEEEKKKLFYIKCFGNNTLLSTTDCSLIDIYSKIFVKFENISCYFLKTKFWNSNILYFFSNFLFQQWHSQSNSDLVTGETFEAFGKTYITIIIYIYFCNWGCMYDVAVLWWEIVSYTYILQIFKQTISQYFNILSSIKNSINYCQFASSAPRHRSPNQNISTILFHIGITFLTLHKNILYFSNWI